jgi:hypothetical protein
VYRLSVVVACSCPIDSLNVVDRHSVGDRPGAYKSRRSWNRKPPEAERAIATSDSHPTAVPSPRPVSGVDSALHGACGVTGVIDYADP